MEMKESHVYGKAEYHPPEPFHYIDSTEIEYSKEYFTKHLYGAYFNELALYGHVLIIGDDFYSAMQTQQYSVRKELGDEGIAFHIDVSYRPETKEVNIGSVWIHTPRGWHGGAKNNKSCSVFLGEIVAEQALSKIFKNVKRMPVNNPGYDFKCNHGYLIDVKASTRRKHGNGWSFGINHNKTPDYFLCIAFDNRTDLNPEHLWLIPASKVNHLSALSIAESRISRWSQYELNDGLNKLIGHCNIKQDYSKKPSVKPKIKPEIVEYPSEKRGGCDRKEIIKGNWY